MRRGTCVKCGASTVRAAANGIHVGQGTKARLQPSLTPGFRGILPHHDADLWAFACTTCGYVEFHLFDPQALAFVGQHWADVPVAPAPPGPAPG